MSAAARITAPPLSGDRPKAEAIKETEGTMPANALADRRTRRRPGARVALLCAVASLLVGLVTASSALADFEIASFDGSTTDQNGEPFTQAGGHPFAFTTSFSFNTDANGNAAENVKDIEVQLPPGFVGDPSATPKCTYSELTHVPPECPASTQVGTLTLTVGSMGGGTEAVYNMVPPANAPAQFAVPVPGVALIIIQIRVRTGSDYGVTAFLPNVSTSAPITASSMTLWGVPADPSYNAERFCAGAYAPGCSTSAPLTPFFTIPTACQGPQTTTLRSDSWQSIGQWQTASFVSHDSSGNPIGVEGCDKLDFSPSMTVSPTTRSADSPSGLDVDLHVPQNESPTGLAEANLKDATVSLPAGVTVNPAAANGLTACTPDEIGMEDESQPTCPSSSKIGSVEVVTPLLTEPLSGAVYVAQQDNNPFKSLLAIYITAQADGTLIKLAGHVVANPTSGQLETTFSENPQLPFSDLRLHFFGGLGAVLATPRTCGQYTTAASLSSWAQPESPVNLQLEPFAVDLAPGGGACSSTGFAPAFMAGTSVNNAGGYGSFVMRLSRKDGEQRFGTVSFAMPPGMEGMISHITPCPETLANAGTCPATSQIGHVTVQAGVGGRPDTLPEPGRQEDAVYLTQSYKGAPFGIAVVVHAEAGPFNLGTVVVRGTVNVNPSTAQVSIATDATGPHAMPTILQGIPVDVKAIDVEVNRPEFMVNPTSCKPMSVAGTIGSAEGASEAVKNRFQAANCAALPFHPTLKATTQGKVSRRKGASLKVTISQKAGEANLHKVDVQLPKLLPSRLETLKLACEENQFRQNPAACPAGSKVGTAVVHTPVLNVPLQGPAILVSHAGRAFPDLDLVLQGDEDGGVVTIIAEAHTFISKKGITYSRFETIPDAPVSTMELTLPEGSHSILGAPAAKGSLCGRRLVMPTTIVGQNGARIERQTRIQPEGCSEALSVRSHQVRGRTLTLRVYVPGAGKLHVSGRGLSSQARKLGRIKIVTVKIHEKQAGKLKTRVVVHFKANGKGGERQAKRLAVKFKSPKRSRKHH